MRRSLFILTFLTPLASAQSHRVDRVDPPLGGQEFPGGRGPNQMVIYTPAYGSPETGTNAWGAEAVVRRGVVESVGHNDSPIPEDGFVVSGHGEARDWLNVTLAPGLAVVFTSDEVRIDDSPEGRWRSMQVRQARLLPALRERGASPETLGRADLLGIQINHMGGRDGTLDEGQLAQFESELMRLEEDALDLRLAAVAAPEGEVRAVWHRLTETTPASIEALAQDLAGAHFNAFFPEVIYGSHAIYPDSTGLYPHWPHFGGTDALAELVRACHARGIEVHAWVHCFFIGVQGSGEEPALLAQTHPDWLERNREGDTVSRDEQRYMFFNPAHPEVRRALIEAYVAMARDYEIDGLHLDYIRYANASSWERLWGHSDFTRARVREELGFDPMDITPADAERWAHWIAWREEQITSFVREVSEAVRAVRPSIRITAAVFPGLEQAIEIKGQNWAAWAREATVDALLPMAYFADAADVRAAVEEMAQQLPPGSPRVVGLAPFLGLSREQMLDQILAAREAGATGQCLFCWDRLAPPVRAMLPRGPWRNETDARWRGAR